MATNILVVDDHYDSVVLLSRVLAQGGYAVWWERSCREAKLVAAIHRIDVLLSEIALPDGDGCQLLADLRERYPQMHAIAYTASASESDRSRMMAAGFGTIVTKPTETKEILRTIDHAVAVVGRSPNPTQRLNPNIFIA
jgi:CheY-like chemotaxis protein